MKTKLIFLNSYFILFVVVSEICAQSNNEIIKSESQLVVEPEGQYDIRLNNADTIATVVVRYENNLDSNAIITIRYYKKSSFGLILAHASSNPLPLGNGKVVIKLPRLDKSNESQKADEYLWKILYMGNPIGDYWSPKTMTFSTLGEPRVIERLPEYLEIHPGDSLHLHISSVGAEKFQWQKNCGYGYDDIQGKTDTTLAITSVLISDACYYRCVLTSSFGETISNSTPVVVK